MKRPPNLTTLAERLAKAVPDGWTVTTGDGAIDMDGEHYDPTTEPHRFVRFERTEGDVNAVVSLNICAAGEYAKRTAFDGRAVEGDVFVNGGCFTRRGIDCSSVSLVSDPKERYEHAYGDVPTMLAGEWDRCVRAVEAKKTAEPIDGTPFKRQPSWFVSASESLKAGKSVSLNPHGFGTGYTLLPKTGRARFAFAKRAPETLERRLGVSPIWIETFDAD